MSDNFTKLYGDLLLSSTLWEECVEARLVFVGILALADWDGHVNIPLVAGLARRLNLTVDFTERGLAVLEAPDPASRSPEEEGRRVLRTRTGWLVVNHSKYREKRTPKQVEDAKRQAKRRGRQNKDKRDKSRDKRDTSQASRDESPDQDQDQDQDREISFDRFWKAYPRKVRKAKAVIAFREAAKKHGDAKGFTELCLAALQWQIRHNQWDGGQFTPHASSWLNGECWEDELPTPLPSDRSAPKAVRLPADDTALDLTGMGGRT